MPINEAEYKRLRKQAEDAKTARDRAAGQLDAAMEKLREDYGCETIEEAEGKLVKLEKVAAKADAAYMEALAKFEEEWGEQLAEN